MVLQFKQANPWFTVYEGEGDEGKGEGDEGKGEGDEGKGEGDEGKVDKTPKTFTQEQVNKMLAEHKRNLQKTVDTQVKELETLRKSKNLTEKEREQLTTQIQGLNDSLLTKEELSRKEHEKVKGEHKRAVDSLAAERDDWKNRYTQSTITRTILDEAVGAEAYSPNQIVALLQGQTRLVEVLDETGSVIPGQYMAKVKMADTDKEGKPTTLDLTIKEALKRMKDRSDDFGNLFKSGVAGGLGDSKNRATGKDVDPSKLGPAAYREYRKKRGW